jgi:hypothetical protein
MARWITAALLSLTVVACANVQPQPYRVEGKPKGVTQAEIDSIVTTAQRYLYGSAPVFSPRWPIYRIFFRSATKAEVWYGNPRPGERKHLIFARRAEGWEITGSGVDLPPRKT